MAKNTFEILKELLINDRSYRRFDESQRIDRRDLLDLVDLTRYCASGRNLQPIKYYIGHEPEICEKIFPLLKWAGYLTDWDGPSEGERPTGYLIQCLDTDLTKNCLCDDGLQLQAITLGAVSKGLGCCIIKSFNAVKLKEVLSMPESLDPIYVLAIGQPIENVVIEDMMPSGEDIKYYRTPDEIHHVPKRPLDDLVVD